jgi:uncharacterized membrane protein
LDTTRVSSIVNFPRLEAFSDGVIAIMVLELKVPHGAEFRVLIPLWPVFMSYVLSFIYVGIYWNKLQHGYYPLTSTRVAPGMQHAIC